MSADRVRVLGQLPGVPYLVAFTGHRPNKIKGKSGAVREFIQDQIAGLGTMPKSPTVCISGMALGVDTIAASLCVEMGYPFIAAVPFPDQDRLWTERDRRRYHELLKKAVSVELLSDSYSGHAYQKRNRWMVDQADYLVAVWDGTPGGTANCVNYAIAQQATRQGRGLRELDGYRFNPATGQASILFPEHALEAVQ